VRNSSLTSHSIDSSSSIQAAIFANGSCDPFTPRTSPCLLGNYVHYSVNVSNAEDIAATIRFADKNRIRLVIRNTGHDYMGRSTGAGGLAIWTHYLKNIEVKDWSDDEYKGKAIKIGAGVQGWEANAAARAAGLVVVTGECPTVGVAGGYTQSGGHSPLSSSFGLSADNTLEFEVVTADGRLVKASPSSKEHAELFWALSGSGSGNFGVVVSVTLRAHPDAVTSGVSFTVSQPGVHHSVVLNAFHAALPGIIDAGTQVTYYAMPSVMVAHSISGYNRTRADLESAIAPFFKSLSALNITVTPNFTTFSSYHDHYLHYYGPLPAGVFGGAGDQMMGGRLVSREALGHAELAAAFNTTMSLGAMFIGQALDVSRFGKSNRRAVQPHWRNAIVMTAYSVPFTFDLPFSEMAKRQDNITTMIMPVVEKLTPKAGAYINEADFQQKDWQETFYGQGNYEKLKRVKTRYDPKGIWWHRIAVGGEGWAAREDGRLCEA